MNQVCLCVPRKVTTDFTLPLTLNRQMADMGRDFCAERNFAFFIKSAQASPN
jgi:hypothetical protein